MSLSLLVTQGIGESADRRAAQTTWLTGNSTFAVQHIGARVGAAAGPGEVLVSRTVRDLVAGSGLTFTSRGEHMLKGISGTWELYAVEDDDSRVHVPHQPLQRTAIDRVAMGAARRTPRLVRAALETANAFQRRRAR